MRTAIALIIVLFCCSCATSRIDNQAPKQELIEIQTMWKNLPSQKDGVKVLTDEDRKEFLVDADEDGHLVWTYDATVVQCHQLPNELCQFVMLEDGTILVARDWSTVTFEHGSLAGEKDIIVAGKIRTEDGYVQYISDFSAQYRVKDCKALNLAVAKLKELKVNLSEMRVSHYAAPCME